MSQKTDWINEQVQRPKIGQPVTICVMRKAHLTGDGNGSVKWELVDRNKPIDLGKDVVFWRAEES